MISKFGGQWSPWLVLLATALAVAQAGTIDSVAILSGTDLSGATQWNSRTGANVLIAAYSEPIWKAPTQGGQWISYALTGQGQLSAPDGDLSSPTAVFYSSFTLPDPSVSGDLWIWADDTAEVWLDQTLLIPVAAPMVRSFWCADAPVSCTPAGGGHASLAGLSAGPHLLEIRAFQLWGDTFGVLYEGNAGFAAAPEPSTFLLMAAATLVLLLATRNCQRVHARISASAEASEPRPRRSSPGSGPAMR